MFSKEELQEQIKDLVLKNQKQKYHIEEMEVLLCNRAVRDCRKDGFDLLNSKEKEVAHMVALGYNNEQIAKNLSISVSMVGQHIGMLYDKLSTTNIRPNRVALALIILKLDGKLVEDLS